MSTRELDVFVGRLQSFVVLNPGDATAGIVTLDNLKAVMRVQHDREDDLIREYGRQATDYVAMRTSMWWGPPREVEAVAFGDNTPFLRLYGAIRRVLGVEGDADGTIGAGRFLVKRTFLRLLRGQWWCETPYTVRYEQGLEEHEIPGDIIAAVKRVATHWYENRVPVQPGAANAVPTDVESILMGRRRARA